jgi:hypothetical protein
MPHIFAAISPRRHATYQVICIPMNGICEVVGVFPVTRKPRRGRSEQRPYDRKATASG